MPKLNYDTTPELIDVAPTEISGKALFNNKADYRVLSFDSTNKMVIMSCNVYPYERLENGDYGERLTGERFPVITKNFVANNETIVNALNGDILCNSDEVTLLDEGGNGYENPVLEGLVWVGEFDFYYFVAKEREVNIFELLKQTVIKKLGTNY